MMAPTGSARLSAIWRSLITKLLGHAVHQIAALDLHTLPSPSSGGQADPILLLDPLGAAFADQEVMVAADYRR